MLSKLIVAGIGLAATGIIAAPIASADANDLTNADVVQAPGTASVLFIPLPPPAHVSGWKYDNGLSSSSQAMLDAVNKARYGH